MSASADNRFTRKPVENVQAGERIVTPVTMQVGDTRHTLFAADATGPVAAVKPGWRRTKVTFTDGHARRFRKGAEVTVG